MPNARKLALEVLREWSRGDAYAAALVDQAVREAGLVSRDAAMVQTLVYGVLRNLSLLDHWSAHLSRDRELDPASRWLLRLGLAQLLLLEMSPHAAVNETVNLATRARGFINAILRRADRDREELLAQVPGLPLHLRCSHPGFLVDRLRSVVGEGEIEGLLAWNQKPAETYVRLNRLHPQAEATLPGMEGLTDVGGDFFRCETTPREALADGRCYAQDPSTAIAPRLLAPTPGMRILDACAAPGGKTALLAQMMENIGTIVATDSSPGRLRRLAGNLGRLQVKNVNALQHDWSQPQMPDFAKDRFDAVLLDVPCSNTGVMRRRIDVRWRLKETDFTKLAATQLGLLKSTLRTLRSGGILVYSTCSIDPEENERVIQRLIADHPDVRLEQEQRSFPTRDGIDGSYSARLKRG